MKGNPRQLRLEAIARAQRHSPFLREALLARPDLAETFVEKGSEAVVAAALAVETADVERMLRLQRRALALSVALGDLAGEATLEQVTATLSDFADQAIEVALRQAVDERVPGAGVEGFAVIAMGKLGSRELNFSSDIDLLLLFDPQMMPRRERDDPAEAAVRIGRRFIEILQKRTADGYVQRVDLRLRPSPEATPIVLPVDAAISHYESSALPWERAAFIRARACGGDIALGEKFLSAIRPFVWRRSLDFGVVDEVRQIATRIRDHFAQSSRFGPGYDLKRGRGGIREIEFFVQIQQMIHGGRDPAVRDGATLVAIDSLVAAERLESGAGDDLAAAYRLLRTIEHRVQMVDDAQTHLLPADEAQLDNVAHLHGLSGGSDILALLKPHIERTGEIFDSLAPDGEQRLASEPGRLAEDLRALGFDEPRNAVARVSEWRSGKARSLRSPAAQAAFEAMLPALLQAIARGADPDHALNRLSDIVERLSSGVNFFRLLEARPALAHVLAKVLAHAPLLADQLARRPELFDGLFDASSFAIPPSVEEFADLLTDVMQGHPYDVALDQVRRLVNEKRFALGVQLIDGHRDPLEVAAGYGRVAEAAILALARHTAAEFERTYGRFDQGELLILGLGRLGGCELTHASDLDIIYLHTAGPDSVSSGPKSAGPNDYFNRLASRVTAALSVPTAAGPLYDVDTRLRPEGDKGMLTVSLDAFDRYQREGAWTWEHMALCRARPVFGSPEVRADAQRRIDEILRMPRDFARTAREAQKMRADMERHKPPKSALDMKLGPGGLIDLEFAVHVLQLTHHVGLDPRLSSALQALAAANLVQPNIIAAQQLLTRMLVMMRLVAPADVRPTDETWQLVAEACGASSWDELLAQHDAARQSISGLWASIKEKAEA